MDAASQPTSNQLIFLRNEESRAKANLERALECYGEQLPLDDPYGVNPRKPHISEVLNIFRAFISEMCEIRRRTPDVNAAADYVYTAVMNFCRMTRSGVAIHQLPDDPAFRDQIQVAIRASVFGSGSAIQREPRAKIEEAQLGTLRTDAAQTAQCVANGVDRNADLASGVEGPKEGAEAAAPKTLGAPVEVPSDVTTKPWAGSSGKPNALSDEAIAAVTGLLAGPVTGGHDAGGSSAVAHSAHDERVSDRDAAQQLQTEATAAPPQPEQTDPTLSVSISIVELDAVASVQTGQERAQPKSEPAIAMEPTVPPDLSTSGPGGPHTAPNGKSNSEEPASTAVQVIQKAMTGIGLNPASLARKIRPILKRRNLKLKADRSTVYRIAAGTTKNPGPGMVSALIEALELKPDQAAILHRDFRNRADHHKNKLDKF
jgi:hypothetical protein